MYDNNFPPNGLIKFINIPKASSATMTYGNSVSSKLLIGLESGIFNLFSVVPEKQEDDEDRLFYLSLLKDIKKVLENKCLKIKIDIYNLIILQNQTTLPPSKHDSPMYNQQYMLSNIGYPNYDTTTLYDPHTRRHHQYTSTEKDIFQYQLTLLSIPFSTPSNVSEIYNK